MSNWEDNKSDNWGDSKSDNWGDSKSDKISSGPHTPTDELIDPINSTLHSLTAPDDLDNHEELFEEERRRNRVDDEEYRHRRRY